MRRIVKNLEQIPNILQKAANIETVKKCAANNSVDGYSSNIYGHEDVRTALISLYHGKCAYCESDVKVIATPNIEHYRPLGRITGVRNPGYEWLGYEWSNLLLACPACNSAKRTKFPLSEGCFHVEFPKDPNGELDISACSSIHLHYSNEHPKILNPECNVIDPIDHIEIDEMGILSEKLGSKLGKCTIDEVDLNRDDLVVARQKVMNDFISEIETALSEKYADIEPLSPLQFTRRLKPIFENILAGLNPLMNYTLLRNCIVYDFEDYILDEIDEVFHDEILVEFISFIEKQV